MCISKDAFYYANPFLVSLDGVRGRLFSKRLHHALTIFATDGGQNVENADRILWERFGCHILGVNYEELTAGITDEDAGRFQMFAPTELVSIINMFEEMPEGFHKIPHLNYLIRRLNGHKHPIYPEAAAVTWPVENGYIEFMESAFGGNNQNFDTLRLILHEKTHMLWAFVFSDSIKNDWIEIGGWYIDPNSSSGWSTTKDVEFVTSYAHAKNPNEDMAESVAFYLKNPEALMSRSLPKYEFIRDRIMHGARYISKIPDHLTFEVLNLWPDYDYPGKINSIDITVTGKEDEDKTITMEVGLQHLDGYEDGASFASTRISSPYFTDAEGKKHTQFVDLGMSPVDGDNHRLRGSVTVNKHSKLGHWITGDICLYDLQGNARYEGRNDCVTDVYINNPMEDLEPTKYVPGSLEYELQDTIVEGHECQKLTVKAKITDNIGVERVVTRIYADVPGFNDGGTGFTDSWGYYYDPTTQIASAEFLITEFYPTAEYYITFFDSYDLAGTETETKFSNSPEDQPIKKIFIKTKNPDTKAPEVDLNRLFVYAEPTHPDAPDGETKVTVNFYARDDKSGFGPCHYNFKDPQGLTHGDWFYHDNQGLFFNGDPTLWKHYQIIHILPQGSAPGIWGLSDLIVGDHACNQYTYNFVETLIFEPDESGTDYVLFSELNDNILSLGLNGISGETYGFTWRIINEDTGAEINGASDDQAAQASLAAKIKRVSSNRTTDIDISALGDGNLIIIVNAFDAEGNILTVKSARVEKRTIILADKVILNATEMTLNTGESATLTATLSPEDTSDKSLTWASSNEEVAIVSHEGVVTAIKAGTATITVTTANGKSAICDVTVIQLAEEIVINETEIKLNIGENITLTATIYPEDTTDKTIYWEIEDETIASVSEEGIVTALEEGTTTISASTQNGLIATCIITVVDPNGVESILQEKTFDIYTLQGVLIKSNATKEDAKRLDQGFYIIAGKKVFVR